MRYSKHFFCVLGDPAATSEARYDTHTTSAQFKMQKSNCSSAASTTNTDREFEVASNDQFVVVRTGPRLTGGAQDDLKTVLARFSGNDPQQQGPLSSPTANTQCSATRHALRTATNLASIIPEKDRHLYCLLFAGKVLCRCKTMEEMNKVANDKFRGLLLTRYCPSNAGQSIQ